MKDTKTQLIPLSVVFKECGLYDLKNITWDNVASIGDNNIDLCILSIERHIEQMTERLQNNFPITDTMHPVLKEDNVKHRETLTSIIEMYSVLRLAWIDALKTQKNGVQKPILPFLRSIIGYPKYTHMVTYPYYDEKESDYSIPFEWFSLAVYNHDVDRLSCVLLEPMIDGNYDGYGWASLLNSPTTMSFTDFEWFQNHKDDTVFTNLWLENTNSFGPKDAQEFHRILDMPSKVAKNFAQTLEALKSHLKNNMASFKNQVYLRGFLEAE